MISNKLLGEVLSIDCNSNKIVGNTVIYNEHYRINVYELMHFCKTWSSTKYKNIFSRCEYKTPNTLGAIAYIIDSFYIDRYHGSRIIESYKADTEPEAVFKACQWIYDKELS